MTFRPEAEYQGIWSSFLKARHSKTSSARISGVKIVLKKKKRTLQKLDRALRDSNTAQNRAGLAAAVSLSSKECYVCMSTGRNCNASSSRTVKPRVI